MRRGLFVFVLVTLALLAAAAACGAPGTATTTQNAANADATNVRRTALAEVQRIIANNPAATATPPATPLPRPSCSGAIWWHEARSHLGELRRIQGTVVASRRATGGAVLLAIGQPYPDPTGVAVLITAGSAASFEGKTVCVSGQITTIEGIPSLQVEDPSGIAVVY